MNKIITIGREFGSGGRELGRRLAEELGIAYYDREIIAEIAKRTELSEQYVQQIVEHRPLNLMPITIGHSICPVPHPLMEQNQEIYRQQAQILTEMSEKSDCVLVGRCADYVLRERKDLLSVFIHAPVAFRADRAQKVYEKEAGNMEDFVRKKDKKRAAFYNYFSQNKWGDARHYHLAISSVYGVDFAVEVLKHAAESFPGGTEK